MRGSGPYKSSRSELFCKKDVLKIFAKRTRKRLCQSLSFDKVAADLSPATLLTKRPHYRCFPENFAKFLRIPFSVEHLGWLLLAVDKSTSFIYFLGKTSVFREKIKTNYKVEYKQPIGN